MPASGTGSGIVRVEVDQNRKKQRTGTVLIAGETLTATQRAGDDATAPEAKANW